MIAPTLVGRAAELELLVETALAPPAVAVIEGEAGIGKTRLVAELRARPELAKRRWLQGGCRKIREPFPLGPVIEAVRGLGGDELRAARLSPVVGALRSLLPELVPWLPLPPEPLDDRAAERHRVFRGLTELLASVGPVVLVLEDLHWADEQTAEFLTYLFGDPPQGLSVVLTYRGEETNPRIRTNTAKLPAEMGRAEVLLDPLDVDQTGTLAASLLGAERVSTDFAEHLRIRASGVPFAIEELLALLQARGTLVHGAAGWARRALDELDVPSGIRDPVLERVARLSEPVRLVVEAAAVLEMPVAASSLVRVSGVREPWTLRAVDEAVTSGLLAEHGDKIAFRHVLAAQAVYEAIPAQRRAQLHSRAASLLEAVDPAPLGQLAYHLKAAGRVHEWARAAEAAADAALALGHDVEAVRLLEGLLREAPLDAEQRCRVALKLGRAAYESSSSRLDLFDLLASVLDEETPQATRGELRFWLSTVVQNAAGDALVKRRLLLEAVEDLDDRPDLKAWAMVGLGIAMQPDVPLSEHKLWLRRALDTVPAVPDPEFQVFLLGTVAMSMLFIGDPGWRRLTDEVVERTGGTPRCRREVDAYLRIALTACYAGDHRRAESLIGRVIEASDARASLATEHELRSLVALLDFCRGSWGGLRERVDQLLEELADQPTARVDVEVVAGCLALTRGDVDDAGRRLAAVAGPLQTSCEWALMAFVASAAARRAGDTGDTAGDVEAVVEHLVATLDAKGLWAPLSRALPAIAQLLIAIGQQSRARALVARFGEEVAGLDAPLAPVALAHARGLLHGAQGHAARAARQLLAAADEYERRACPYEAAQAREQAAATLLAADPAAGERELRAALDAYQALGASWDHARCVRTGREHGLRLAATHRGGRKGYGEALSPREAEVARLAADGLSNRVIAAQLYLSPNTVDKHLGRAMRKLGVHSRAALAARLAQRSDGQDAAGGR